MSDRNKFLKYQQFSLPRLFGERSFDLFWPERSSFISRSEVTHFLHKKRTFFAREAKTHYFELTLSY